MSALVHNIKKTRRKLWIGPVSPSTSPPSPSTRRHLPVNPSAYRPLDLVAPQPDPAFGHQDPAITAWIRPLGTSLHGIRRRRGRDRP